MVYDWGVVTTFLNEPQPTSRNRKRANKGIGKKLCCIIIDILKYQGIKNVYSKVTVPNTKSEKLHYSLGFNLIGSYNNIGYKNGKWHSVRLFEKELLSDYNNPKAIIPIKEIDEEKITFFIENYK